MNENKPNIRKLSMTMKPKRGCHPLEKNQVQNTATKKPRSTQAQIALDAFLKLPQMPLPEKSIRKAVNWSTETIE